MGQETRKRQRENIEIKRKKGTKMDIIITDSTD